jgi:CheY-like chemotaxis protein
MTTDFEQEVRNSTILIADDTEQNVELLQAYLDDLGCRIVTAFDGQETLDRVADAKPDLILLDIMMPKLSGFEICRKLKSDPATRNIPICMVTALTEDRDIERAVDAGTDDFLSKPINKWELLTRVRSLLRVRHLQNELERTLSYLEEVDQTLCGSAAPPGKIPCRPR